MFSVHVRERGRWKEKEISFTPPLLSHTLSLYTVACGPSEVATGLLLLSWCLPTDCHISFVTPHLNMAGYPIPNPHTWFTSIHHPYPLSFKCRWGLEPIPADIGWEMESTLDGSPAHHGGQNTDPNNSHSPCQFRVSNLPNYFGLWEEAREPTHTETWIISCCEATVLTTAPQCCSTWFTWKAKIQYEKFFNILTNFFLLFIFPKSVSSLFPVH